jgi:hypothetical protein
MSQATATCTGLVAQQTLSAFLGAFVYLLRDFRLCS